MAEIILSDVRIGFPYVAEIDFPSGFLAAGEGVRGKLRRYANDSSPIIFADSRDVDKITWELSEVQTASMRPGTYLAEAEVYETALPGNKGVLLTNNLYLLECDYSPSA